MSAAERFIDLACLTYRDDESRARRVEAAALLASTPSLVYESPHAAAAAGDIDALRVHLDRDTARVSQREDARGFVPLLALCYSRVNQRDALACLGLLLQRGSDPNAHVFIDECRFTALTGVMGEGEAGPFEQPPHPEAGAMAERLLDSGASPNESQGLYNTHFLPSNVWLERLFARGLSSIPDLELLLGQAVIQGFVERVRLLLQRGMSPDGRNRYNGRTHIENAYLEGHAEIARVLIAAGALLPTFTTSERFQIAVLANDTEEAERLRSSVTTDVAPLIAAARHGRVDAVGLALAMGLPIDGQDAAGLTALHHAARNGHIDVVQKLVARGASLVIRDSQYDGTPLGHALHFTNRWPREHGADVVALLERLTPGR